MGKTGKRYLSSSIANLLNSVNKNSKIPKGVLKRVIGLNKKMKYCCNGFKELDLKNGQSVLNLFKEDVVNNAERDGLIY